MPGAGSRRDQAWASSCPLPVESCSQRWRVTTHTKQSNQRSSPEWGVRSFYWGSILIAIVEYLFFEFLALFLGLLYYATSALNFKCDKQSMSVGGRWLMTSSDRAFKPALFSEKRYFHVNLLCVLQRWDKSPAHNSGKVGTTRSREGPWLDCFKGKRREGSGRLSSSAAQGTSQSLCIMSDRERWISPGHPRLTPEPLFTASTYYSWKQIFPRGRKQVLLRVCVSLWSLDFVK